MVAERAAPRVPLSTARVLTAAVAFADEHGVDALTMRKLADQLGFGVMSLYNHVANKDDMLDGMVEVVAGEIERPAPGAEWREAIRSSAVSAHDALIRHPWAADLWSKRRPGPARLAHMAAILAALGSAGLSDELVYRGFHAVNMHIVGFTSQELDFQIDDRELEAMANDFTESLPPGEYPHLIDHVRAHLVDDGDDEFEFVLDLILDGLDNAGAGGKD